MYWNTRAFSCVRIRVRVQTILLEYSSISITTHLPVNTPYKPLKKSSAIQVWGMISFLLLIYEKRNWYHWKAWLLLFTMMCHLPWLCNHGMCSTPEYRAKSEVKCCKMHCFQHRSLHNFWRCNVFWIVPRWQCMSCMNVNGVMFFSLKDEMCLNDVQVVIDEVQRHEWCYPLLFGRWNLPWIMFVWGRAAVYWVVVCKM